MGGGRGLLRNDRTLCINILFEGVTTALAIREIPAPSEYRRRMRFDRRMRLNRTRRLTAITSLMIVALTAQIVAAQTPTLKTRTREDRDREFQASHRITLNVQVTDASGKPVTDLEARDFTILDGREARKIATFHAIDGEAMNDATEVVILLDAVNSTAQALDAEKEGILKFLAASHGPLPYPTSFVLWSNGHLKATAATTDRNAVGRAFVSITKNLHSNACSPVDGSVAQAVEAGGPGALGDSGIGARVVSVAQCLQVHFKDSVAALDGIAQQQLARGGRTLLIWVGPGWPLLSDVEFKQLTPAARKSYYGEVVTVLHDLDAAQITLDAVGPRDAAREVEIARVDLPALTAGTASPENAAPSSLALQVLAQQTGGHVSSASSSIPNDLGKFLDDADWYYALSFNPPPAQNGAELRAIEVKVNRPGVTIHTATAYYLQP
jgi:VWFA-related protein